ncbi:zinc finger protein 236-like isoform X1 [Danaus plexippus]|uniref:zinc finger protein 236-like isoform X1 n=1 Tax=Danaus plexippus TaxID=13037 RepID=UPI002AB1815E|nr:zinc finger protein 236-like isoform X1 [Danaus plexippus]
MAPKIKQSREEVLKKKREAERVRYYRRKNDPQKREEMRVKQNVNYERRKQTGLRKLVKDMTPNEHSTALQKWKEYCRVYRERKRIQESHNTDIDEIEETIARMTSNSILKKLNQRSEDNLKFDVKVEVEEVEEHQTNDLNITIGSVVSLKGTADDALGAADEEQNLDDTADTKLLVREYDFKATTVIDELNKMKNMTNIADVLIDVSVRNYFGRYFFKVDAEVKEAKLLVVFAKWQTWCRMNPDDRDAPLLYKCYICRRSWWHYHEFREHFHCHDDFNLDIDQFGQECIVFAYSKEIQQNDISVIGNCWRCGNDFLFHQNKRRYKKLYDCSGCLAKFTTCLKLSNHVGGCNYYKRSLQALGKNVSQIHPCDVCPVKCFSQTDLAVHIKDRHSVRSDLPIVATHQKCSHCSQPCDALTHECKNQPYIKCCELCDRKFHRPINYQIHVKNNRNQYKCKVCDEQLPGQCMEVKHLMKHTNNFVYLYRCLLCPSPVYFSKKNMLEEHNDAHHQENSTKYFFDEVVVPKSLIKTKILISRPRIRRKDHLKPIKQVQNNETKPLSIPWMHRAGAGSMGDVGDTGQTQQNNTEHLETNEAMYNLEPVITIKKELNEDDLMREIKQEAEELMIYDGIGDEMVIKQEIVEHVIQVCEYDDINVGIKTEPADDDEVTNDEYLLDIRNLAYNCTKLYSCKKCLFQGVHREYMEHLKSKCLHRTKYYCSKCKTTYLTMKRYLVHFRRHGYEENTCPKCIRTVEMSQLIAHVYQHVKNTFIGCHYINDKTFNKCYQCRECREVVQFCDFFKHWELHLELKTEDSAGRNDLVENKPLLKELIALLLGDTMDVSKELHPKQCIMCLKLFSRKNDLKRHLIEHLLNDAYRNRQKYECLRCQICSVGFNKTDIYKRHMRDHGSLPLYKCEICDKTFSDSSNFSKHKKVHNMSVVICDICKKKFTCKAILVKHMELHKILKPISCECCSRVFHSPSLYRKHRLGKNRFKCPACKVLFNKLKDKWDHMWLEHKERKYIADCPICKKSFRKYQDVKVHIRREHDAKYVYRPVFHRVDEEEIIVCD